MRQVAAMRGAACGVPRRELACVFAPRAGWRGVSLGAPRVGARPRARRARGGGQCA